MTTGLKQVQYPQLDMLAVHQGVRKFNSAKAEQVFDFLGILRSTCRVAAASRNFPDTHCYQPKTARYIMF